MVFEELITLPATETDSDYALVIVVAKSKFGHLLTFRERYAKLISTSHATGVPKGVDPVFYISTSASVPPEAFA